MIVIDIGIYQIHCTQMSSMLIYSNKASLKRLLYYTFTRGNRLFRIKYRYFAHNPNIESKSSSSAEQ